MYRLLISAFLSFMDPDRNRLVRSVGGEGDQGHLLSQILTGGRGRSCPLLRLSEREGERLQGPLANRFRGEGDGDRLERGCSRGLSEGNR